MTLIILHYKEEIITNIINSFSPAEVFSSLSNFLSSGYVFILVIALLAWGIMKKLIKLVVFAGFCFILWSILASGVVSFPL